MKRKDIEKYTKEFLEIYRKKLSDAGLNESAANNVDFYSSTKCAGLG